MSFLAELFSLIGSAIGLISVIIEACSRFGGRERYVPKHMKRRHGGTARKNEKSR